MVAALDLQEAGDSLAGVVVLIDVHFLLVAA